MERSWDVIRRYGTQSIMKVGLNQPIMREVLEKIMNSIESDVLTESVTEDSADDQRVTKKLPVRRARKGLKRLKGKTGSRAVNQRVVKSKASAVVISLTSAGLSGESGQGDGATLTGGEKENLIPPMLLAGLTTTATKSKKTARTLADTKLEMEIISQCGLDDYRPSQTNMAKMKLEGQLDVVECSRVTVPESVHMGDLAGGYVEMLKARNSARGHLMAWNEKRAMQEYLKVLTENSNLNRKEHGTVMSSEANEIGLEKLLEISWRAALQRYSDETMHAPATVAAYLAHPCTRTDLQLRLAWCLMGIKKAEYEASNDLKSKEQELNLMEALRAQHSGMEGHVCNLGHCLITLSEQHRQLARLYGRLSMSDKSGMELVADCHGVTDVNLTTALGFCSMTSSIESLERLERTHELVTSLSVEVFPGALQREQMIGGWREALENEMNLKDSEAYHRPTGSKYLVSSSSAPYCNSRYPAHMVVMDARTQQVLIDQLFSVPKCVRLARMSERSYDLLAKIFWAVPKRSEGELQDVVGEEFMRLKEDNVSEFYWSEWSVTH